MSAPGTFAARRVSANVSLLDLAPTLLEIASQPRGEVDAFDGESLVPLLNGRDRDDAVVAEYLAEGAVAPVVMIRRGSLKFITSPGDPDQLFDLDADPRELINLATASSRRREVAAFGEEVAARWDLASLREKVVTSQRNRRLIADALAEGEQSAWDYREGDDRGARYVRGRDFWAPFKRARLRRQPSAE